MKICFFGSSLVSSYWNGAATYYRGVVKGLASLGHDVTFYEPDAFDRQQHRDFAVPSWAQVVVYPATEQGWQSALEEAARDADMLVKTSGIGVFDAELEAAILDAAPSRVLKVYWDVDAPATLEAIAADPNHPMRRHIPHYNMVLTYGGGDPVVNGFASLGAQFCEPVYNALDPETHHPVPRRPDMECDLSFLGHRLPDREARVHDFFFGAAARLPSRAFSIGGNGWEHAPTPNVRLTGYVGSTEHNAFFGSALATLNVNRASMARNGYSPPTRVFEAAGAGACLITDAWEGIEFFLEPGTEVFSARNGEEVASILDGLTSETARRIGEAARQRILSEHTYAHRAKQIGKILDMNMSSREAAE